MTRFSTRLALTVSTVFFGAALAAGAAQAGNFTYVDGKGNWQSTQCQKPTGISGLNAASDAAANDLNAQIMQHNGLVNDMAGYLNCVSEEASRDASAASQLIIGLATQQIEQMQTDLTKRSQNLQLQAQ
jgi:hypothetical protein